MKLAAYAKLCSGFEANCRGRSASDASSLGADQVAGGTHVRGMLLLVPADLHPSACLPWHAVLVILLLPTHCPLLLTALCGTCLQLAQSKAAELEDLLQRLSDLNDEMSGLTGGSTDSRSHTLARHRDILQDFTQVRPKCSQIDWDSQGTCIFFDPKAHSPISNTCIVSAAVLTAHQLSTWPPTMFSIHCCM